MLLDFKLDLNWRSKSAVLESKLSTIPFVCPNRISLQSYKNDFNREGNFQLKKRENKECREETNFRFLPQYRMFNYTSLTTSTPSGFSQQLKIFPSWLQNHFHFLAESSFSKENAKLRENYSYQRFPLKANWSKLYFNSIASEVMNVFIQFWESPVLKWKGKLI